MKRFECEVERIDKYIIEIDETKFAEEDIEHFKKYFADFNTYEEHAEYIAGFRSRFGERYIEGIGNPLVNGKEPWNCNEGEANTAINIKVISEDEEINVWSKELEEEK